MNYRPMFEFPTGERCGNAQVFAKKSEAQNSAADRLRFWAVKHGEDQPRPTGFGVDETPAPVTYKWTAEGGDKLSEAG